MVGIRTICPSILQLHNMRVQYFFMFFSVSLRQCLYTVKSINLKFNIRCVLIKYLPPSLTPQTGNTARGAEFLSWPLRQWLPVWSGDLAVPFSNINTIPTLQLFSLSLSLLLFASAIPLCMLLYFCSVGLPLCVCHEQTWYGRESNWFS